MGRPDAALAVTGTIEIELKSVARQYEPDRYGAALLAPRSAQRDLILLATWLGELRRIGHVANEPTLAQIRLQWWVDAFGALAGDLSGHPVADAFHDVARRRSLDPSLIKRIFETTSKDLALEPPTNLPQVTELSADREGSAFELAFAIMECTIDPRLQALCREAGQGYGLARRVAEGVEPNANRFAEAARDHLKRARRMFRERPATPIAALLPLALVEPYSRASSTVIGRGGVATRTPVSPLSRLWRLWLAKQFSRF